VVLTSNKLAFTTVSQTHIKMAEAPVDNNIGSFDPWMVDLTSDDLDNTYVFCDYGYDGSLSPRISALLVILIASTASTFLPVVAARVPRVRVTLYVCHLARYFGAASFLLLHSSSISHYSPYRKVKC
jgi:hypothetical protein